MKVLQFHIKIIFIFILTSCCYAQQSGPNEISSGNKVVSDIERRPNLISCVSKCVIRSILQNETFKTISISLLGSPITTMEPTTTMTTITVFSTTTLAPKKLVPTYRTLILVAMKSFGDLRCNTTKTTCKQQQKKLYTVDNEGNLLIKGAISMKFHTVCENTSFYISARTATTDKIWPDCCTHNLIPAYILNNDELECLREPFRKGPNPEKVQLMHVGAADPSLERKFAGCPSGFPLPEDLWASEEPDNKEGEEPCVDINLCGSCNSSGYRDESCTVNRKLLCQSKPSVYKDRPSTTTTTTTTTTTPLPTTILTTITSINESISLSANDSSILYNNSSFNSSILSLFSNANDSSIETTTSATKPPRNVPKTKYHSEIYKSSSPSCAGLVKKCNIKYKNFSYAENVTVQPPSKSFNFLSVCAGTVYFETAMSVDVNGHWKTCCSEGLIPATVESLVEFNCLQQALQLKKRKKSITFLTSVRDYSLKRDFKSCPSDLIVPDELWAKGEPNNYGGNEPCVFLDFCIDCETMGFVDAYCAWRLPGLCKLPSIDVRKK